jgi:hypothetical protein
MSGSEPLLPTAPPCRVTLPPHHAEITTASHQPQLPVVISKLTSIFPLQLAPLWSSVT